jgi:hypothetical protein
VSQASRLIREPLAEVRSWPASRGWIAVGAGVGAAALLVVTGSLLTAAAPVPWWTWVVVAAGALVFGLVVATFRGAPVGAESAA